MIVLWDGGPIHKGPDVRALLRRLHVERFPGYAPELNPDEFVWTHLQAALANGHPDHLQQLLRTLCHLIAEVQRRAPLSFAHSSPPPISLIF